MHETTEKTYPAQLPLDGRTWWAVRGGDADERLVCARTKRSAIAAVKRAWIAGDRTNGISVARAVQTVSVARWSAEGPFTTPQAYHRARRQMLYEATANSIVFAAVKPENVDDREQMVEVLGERGLMRLEAGIVEKFTDPDVIIV